MPGFGGHLLHKRMEAIFPLISIFEEYTFEKFGAVQFWRKNNIISYVVS